MADIRIHSVLPSTAIRPVALPELRDRVGVFGETLSRAVGELNAIQLAAQQAAVQVANGESQDPTQAVVALQKADIAFQFALQIRNKLLEAYQELMRMPV